MLRKSKGVHSGEKLRCFLDFLIFKERYDPYGWGQEMAFNEDTNEVRTIAFSA